MTRAKPSPARPTTRPTISSLPPTTPSAPGITYAVEFSDALTSWAVNASASESVTSLDTTFERVTVTDSTTPANRFVRVRITTL